MGWVTFVTFVTLKYNSKKVIGLIPELVIGPFCVDFLCCVGVGFLQVLISDSKLH